VSTDGQTSEAESIAAELRAAIRQARVAGSPALAGNAANATLAAQAQIEPELQILRSTYDVASAPFTSHRRILGPFIILIKNFTRELLVQLLARQSVYNGAAARAIAHLSQRLNALADENARLAHRIAALEADIESGRTAARPSPQLAHPHQADGFELERFEDPRPGVAPSVFGGKKRGAPGRA